MSLLGYCKIFPFVFDDLIYLDLVGNFETSQLGHNQAVSQSV